MSPREIFYCDESGVVIYGSRSEVQKEKKKRGTTILLEQLQLSVYSCLCLSWRYILLLKFSGVWWYIDGPLSRSLCQVKKSAQRVKRWTQAVCFGPKRALTNGKRSGF